MQALADLRLASCLACGAVLANHAPVSCAACRANDDFKVPKVSATCAVEVMQHWEERLAFLRTNAVRARSAGSRNNIDHVFWLELTHFLAWSLFWRRTRPIRPTSSICESSASRSKVTNQSPAAISFQRCMRRRETESARCEATVSSGLLTRQPGTCLHCNVAHIKMLDTS